MIQNRRKVTDFWAGLLFYLNIIAWILLIILLLVFHRAQPEFETVFDRVYQLDLRTNWDSQYLYYLTYTVIFGILLSLTGLSLGIFRGRRQKDSKTALIITGGISLLMLTITVFVL